MRKFITVNINGKALANPNLLDFAHVVSLLEGKNPAVNSAVNLNLRRMTL